MEKQTESKVAESKVADVNYTEEMVAIMREHAPLNKEKAEALEPVLGRSWRSIVSKARREGIEYQVQQAAPKRGRDAPTKAQLAESLREITGFKLPSVDNASVAALTQLLTFARDLTGESESDEAA